MVTYSDHSIRGWLQKSLAIDGRLPLPILEKVRRLKKVMAQDGGNRGEGGDLTNGRIHVSQPRIAGFRTDCERDVPHPQTGVTAFLGIQSRAAEVLDEEKGEILPRFRHPFRIGGIHGAQDRVLFDTDVKSVHQRGEGFGRAAVASA